MAGLQVASAIVRDPDLTVMVLPNQDLERQIDRYAGRGYSERDYDYGAPRDRYEPDEEREPAR